MEENGKHICMKCLNDRWGNEEAAQIPVEPTPEATAPSPPEKSNPVPFLILCSIVLLVVSIRFMILSKDFQPSPPYNPAQQQAAPAQQQQKAWNEGGTLHQVTGQEWQAAGAVNRLATASDFVASQKDHLKRPFTTEGELQAMSIELGACITEATKPPGDTQKVSTIAAMCTITMGWLK